MPFIPSPLRLPAALSAALVLGLGAQLAMPAPQEAGDIRPSLRRTETVPSLPAPLSTFVAIEARPVFSPDRARGGEAGAAVAAEGQLVLAGVGSGPGGGSATLRTPDGALQTIGLGQVARGWRLVLTSADAAVLERDGMRQVLQVGVVPAAPALNAPPTPMSAAPSVPPPFSVHGSR